MKTALHFHPNPEQQSQEFNTLFTSFSSPGSPMVVANTIWMQKGFNIEQEFLDVNAKYSYSDFRQVDFAEAPDATRMEISALIEKQTWDKIIDLLPAGFINPDTRLVITNVIYLKIHGQ